MTPMVKIKRLQQPVWFIDILLGREQGKTCRLLPTIETVNKTKYYLVLTPSS